MSANGWSMAPHVGNLLIHRGDSSSTKLRKGTKIPGLGEERELPEDGVAAEKPKCEKGYFPIVII